MRLDFSDPQSRIFHVSDVLEEMRRQKREIKPLINFSISVTWIGGLFTSFTMMFPDSIAAEDWARDQYGLEPKIKVEPA